MALFINFIIYLVSNYLNILNLNKAMPESIADLYNGDEYKKSQNYIKNRTKFSLIHELVSLSAFFMFWIYSGFAYLDTFVRQFQMSTSFRGVLYIGIFIGLSYVLNLPFNIYNTFVIENKFGFNRTSYKTFMGDTLKSLVLMIVIGCPLIYFILHYFETYGYNAWYFAWAFITLFSMLIQFLAPKFIMPLFNKFTPIEDNELKAKITDYCKKVSFPLKNIYIIDGSKRTNKANAYFTGFGKNKTIALYDNLLKNHTDNEILVILAHEIGHYKKKHVLFNLGFFILHSGVILFLLNHFIWEYELYTGFFLYNLSIYAGFIFFFMLYTPIEMVINPLLNLNSRANEYQADKFAVETTGLHCEMVTALKKLAKNNLANPTPHPFFVFMNYSHPTIDKRIERIMALKK